MEKKVSNAKRIVSYELTSEEAKEIAEWYHTIRMAKAGPQGVIPSAVQQFMEPLFAVAEQREYGGH